MVQLAAVHGGGNRGRCSPPHHLAQHWKVVAAELRPSASPESGAFESVLAFRRGLITATLERARKHSLARQSNTGREPRTSRGVSSGALSRWRQQANNARARAGVETRAHEAPKESGASGGLRLFGSLWRGRRASERAHARTPRPNWWWFSTSLFIYINLSPSGRRPRRRRHNTGESGPDQSRAFM